MYTFSEGSNKKLHLRAYVSIGTVWYCKTLIVQHLFRLIVIRLKELYCSLIL